MMKLSSYLIIGILLATAVFAHHEEEQSIDIPTRGATGQADIYNERAGEISIYATVLLLVIAFLALTQQKSSNTIKALLFILLCLITLAATIYLVGSTLYINLTSSTKGPVHWHTDFELWNCGQRVNLEDPKGLSNRIGT